jgi:hypothetical protein
VGECRGEFKKEVRLYFGVPTKLAPKSRMVLEGGEPDQIKMPYFIGGFRTKKIIVNDT